MSKMSVRTFGLAGERIWLLASGGEDGVAALADAVEAGCKAAHIVGWVTFTAVITYSSFDAWRADCGVHCVDEGSPYAYRKGITMGDLSSSCAVRLSLHPVAPPALQIMHVQAMRAACMDG